MITAQLEYVDVYSDPLPCADTFDRMEELIRERRRTIITARAKLMQLEMFDRRFMDIEYQASNRRGEIINRLTRAELRRTQVELDIIEVARLIVAEADEVVTV